MSKTRGSHDTVLQAVMLRLEEWAEWYSREPLGGLGYPSASLEHRVLRGGKTARGTGVPAYASHAAAEEIEAWVNEMALQNPPMAASLRRHYFYPGTLRQQAVQLGLSHTQFKFILGMAHQWLAGRLSLTH